MSEDTKFDLGERIAATVAAKQRRTWAALRPPARSEPVLDPAAGFNDRLRIAIRDHDQEEHAR